MKKDKYKEKEKKMKRKRGRKKLGVLIASAMMIMSCCMTVNAKNVGSFNFYMHTRVIGKAPYKLATKTTSVSAKANTYKFENDKAVSSDKLKYGVKLHKKNTIGKYTSFKTANGKTVTWNLSKLEKGTYNIDTMTNQDIISRIVRGSGNIIQ